MSNETDIEAELDALRAEIARFVLESIQTDARDHIGRTFRDVLSATLPPIIEQQFQTQIQKERVLSDRRLKELEDRVHTLGRSQAAIAAALQRLDKDLDRFTRQVTDFTDAALTMNASAREQDNSASTFLGAASAPDFRSALRRRRSWSRAWIGAAALGALLISFVMFVATFPSVGGQHFLTMLGLRSESPKHLPSQPSEQRPLMSTQNATFSPSEEVGAYIESNWRAVVSHASLLPPRKSKEAFKVLCGADINYRAHQDACPAFALRKDQIVNSVAGLNAAIQLTVDTIGYGTCKPPGQGATAASLTELWTCILRQPSHATRTRQ